MLDRVLDTPLVMTEKLNHSRNKLQPQFQPQYYPHGSGTIAPEEKCPQLNSNPNPNPNPKPNPNPNRGAIFLGGNCPDTYTHC